MREDIEEIIVLKETITEEIITEETITEESITEETIMVIMLKSKMLLVMHGLLINKDSPELLVSPKEMDHLVLSADQTPLLLQVMELMDLDQELDSKTTKMEPETIGLTTLTQKEELNKFLITGLVMKLKKIKPSVDQQDMDIVPL